MIGGEIIDKAEVKEVKKENNKKVFLKKSFDVIFWVLIIGLSIIWLTDFIRVLSDNDPIFCLKEETLYYSDGEVNECVGLGYKVFDYNRTSLKSHQFSPFFVKIKE